MSLKNVDQIAMNILESIKCGQYSDAIELGGEALGLCEDRPELALKIHCWMAQASLSKRDPRLAAKHVLKGLKLSRMIQDEQGEAVLKDMQDQAKRMGAALAMQNNKTPLGNAMETFKSGNRELAIQLAKDVAMQADLVNDPKNRVLARLSLAQFGHEVDTQLYTALSIANQEDDRNLISAVKRTMDILGHCVEPKVF